jgi:hypothetical protein
MMMGCPCEFVRPEKSPPRSAVVGTVPYSSNGEVTRWPEMVRNRKSLELGLAISFGT